jgi:steroid delta-isomerase-like uncharacterized protein
VTVPPEANLASVRRVFDEVFQKGNTEHFLQALAPHAVVHLAGLPEPLRGREAAKAWADEYVAGFDASITIDGTMASGEEVVVRWTNVAIHRGPYNGMPATGRQVRFTAIEWFRFEDGLAVEIWHRFDTLDVVQQLGALPRGKPPAALMYVVVGLQKLRRLVGGG